MGKSIDEWSPNRAAWARYGEECDEAGKPIFRYRLARALTNLGVEYLEWRAGNGGGYIASQGSKRVTFVMLNPSTATAFRLDPTVAKCIKFAELWDADVIEVVNLFAYRSTYPEDLRRRQRALLNIVGPENDSAILEACAGAERVVAAWGIHGAIGERGSYVAGMLYNAGVKLEALGRSALDGSPCHPLARGKRHIALNTEPQPWP